MSGFTGHRQLSLVSSSLNCARTKFLQLRKCGHGSHGSPSSPVPVRKRMLAMNENVCGSACIPTRQSSRPAPPVSGCVRVCMISPGRPPPCGPGLDPPGAGGSGAGPPVGGLAVRATVPDAAAQGAAFEGAPVSLLPAASAGACGPGEDACQGARRGQRHKVVHAAGVQAGGKLGGRPVHVLLCSQGKGRGGRGAAWRLLCRLGGSCVYSERRWRRLGGSGGTSHILPTHHTPCRGSSASWRCETPALTTPHHTTRHNTNNRLLSSTPHSTAQSCPRWRSLGSARHNSAPKAEIAQNRHCFLHLPHSFRFLCMSATISAQPGAH